MKVLITVVAIVLLPTGETWASADDESLDVLRTAITAGHRFPPLQASLQVFMTAAPSKNMTGTEVFYEVETDWQSAFVSWSDTRPNDPDLPRSVGKWSFNGMESRYDSIDPPALGAQVSFSGTLAEASNALSGLWIDLRNIGIWPLPFATLRKDWVSRSDEFVRTAKEHSLQIETIEVPDGHRQFVFSESYPNGSTKRKTTYEISEALKLVTRVVVENFQEDVPGEIKSKTSITTAWEKISNSESDYFPSTVEFSRIGSNGKFVELETWKTLSVRKLDVVPEASLDWAAFQLPVGRLVDFRASDRTSQRFEWDGSQFVDWAPPSTDVLTAEIPPKGIRLWVWLNALIAALLLTIGAVRLIRRQGRHSTDN